MAGLRADCRQVVLETYGKFLREGYSFNLIGRELRAALLWAKSGAVTQLDIDAAAQRSVDRTLRATAQRMLARLPTEMEAVRPLLEVLASLPGQAEEDD